MTSASLASLLTGVAEVRALRTHFVVRRASIPSGPEADATKAHGRACVVLLSSHWERYFYSVNEEAIDWINAQGCRLDLLPTVLLLKHSQGPIDEIAQTSWNGRESKLRTFISTDGALWTAGGVSGSLDHSQLLTWMKSPKPTDITRLYKQYGVENIFESITRKPSSRRSLYLDLKELVEKRNLVAHGDATVEALPSDVTRYLWAVEKFARSSDLLLSRELRKLTKAAHKPW